MSRLSIAVTFAALLCVCPIAASAAGYPPQILNTATGQTEAGHAGDWPKFQAGTTTAPPFELPEGVAPTSPGNGQCWMTTAGMFCHNSGPGTLGPFGLGAVNSAALDSAFGSTQGNILYRGASAWTVLAPPSGLSCLSLSGASANPAWTASGTAPCASGGGGGGSSGQFGGLISAPATLSSSGLGSGTWFNQNSATATNNAIGITIAQATNAGGENANVLCVSMPATPFIRIYNISVLINESNFVIVGVALGNSTNHKYLTGAIRYDSQFQVTAIAFSSVTSASLAGTAYLIGNSVGSLFVRLSNDGTNLTVDFSLDGVQYNVGYGPIAISSTVFSGGAPDEICALVDANGGPATESINLFTP
jgi:hypothetical protein